MQERQNEVLVKLEELVLSAQNGEFEHTLDSFFDWITEDRWWDEEFLNEAGWRELVDKRLWQDYFTSEACSSLVETLLRKNRLEYFFELFSKLQLKQPFKDAFLSTIKVVFLISVLHLARRSDWVTKNKLHELVKKEAGFLYEKKKYLKDFRFRDVFSYVYEQLEDNERAKEIRRGNIV